MPYVAVVGEIIVALLSVIGFYTILRVVADRWLCSHRVVVSVLIRETVDDGELDMLLSEATRHPARRRGQRVVLMVAAELMDGRMGTDGRLAPAAAVVAARYGAEVGLFTACPYEDTAQGAKE